MKKLLFVFLFPAFLWNAGAGQSPYQLDWSLELRNMLAGASLNAAGARLTSMVIPFTPEELATFNGRTLRSFDGVATTSNVPGAAVGSDWLLRSSLALPVLFLLPEDTRGDFGKIALLYAEVVLITKGITQVTKASVLRPRPFVFNEEYGDEHKISRGARFSFFSGHASATAANCFFVAKVFADYYPDSKWKPVVWGVAAAVPALTGYFRVAAGRHYPSDVIVGYGVGAALGILIPQLHKNIEGDSRLSFSPGIGGGRLVWTF